MSEKKCPVCGLGNVIETDKDQALEDTFGGTEMVTVKDYQCGVCDASGDLFDENESALQHGISSLKAKAVENILKDFTENYKTGFSAIERALELPQRTLTKWKSGASKPSSAALALLKMIDVFPWLLKVADNKYDYTIARQIHLNDAFQTFIGHMDFKGQGLLNAGAFNNDNGTFYFLNIPKSSDITQPAVEEQVFLDSEPKISFIRESY